MKLKFRYALFILLSGTFIAADHVRAVEPDPSNNVRLDLFVQYPNVRWTSTHRRRFEQLTYARKTYLLNTCDAEKCEVVLSSYGFDFLHTCSTREFKNFLRFPLDVVENFLYRAPQEFLLFLRLNDDELNVLLGFSPSRILKFRSNPEQFSSILKVGLNYFRPLNDDQFNNIFQLFLKNNIKELKRFAPEHIPVLLETENLEKTDTILYCLRTNPQASRMLEPQTIMRFLHLPLDAVKTLMHTFDPQRHGPFVHLNDAEFTMLRGFSDARIIQFVRDSELFSLLLDVGLQHFQPLHDDQLNKVFRTYLRDDIKELKRFSSEDIPVLLETENWKSTETILRCLRRNSKVSKKLETKPIMRLLNLPFDAVRRVMDDNDQQHHPFLKLNDDEFTTLRGFSDSRIIQFTSNPKVFSSLLDVGLEYFQPLHDDQFNNVFKIFWTDDIKELKRFAPEHIPVLLETKNFEKTKTILDCLRTNPQASQMLEPQTTIRFLHLPLDAVKKLMYTFDPQRHGPFVHLNDDEFNEFKKFSTDRMKTLIGHGEILPDILKFGLKQVRNLPDYEFNTLVNRTLDQVGQLR